MSLSEKQSRFPLSVVEETMFFSVQIIGKAKTTIEMSFFYNAHMHNLNDLSEYGERSQKVRIYVSNILSVLFTISLNSSR